MRVGIDLVRIERINESLERFGDTFLQRLFTAGEIAYANAAPAHTAERLAARFAAKEAAIKALRLSERGVDWRDIEVVRLPDGDCELKLHGEAQAAARAAGLSELALSLSHEVDYAAAVVVAQRPQGNR